MKFRKILLSAATFVVVTMLCIIGAGAETYGDYTYTILSDGTVEITAYTGSAAEITIPSTIDSKTVTSIGEKAFYNCTAITSVDIPDSVTCISDRAFTGCTALTVIDMGKGVTTIGDFAFRGCSALMSIDTGAGVTEIGEYAFAYCSSLSSVTLHEGLKRINDRAFTECRLLESVNIPDSVESIGEGVFYYAALHLNHTTDVIYVGKWVVDCNGYRNGEELEAVTVKDGITHIADEAFSACMYAKSITLPDSITHMGDSVFRYCEALETMTIPDGVTALGDGTFYGCTALKSVSIPDSVTSLGEAVFYDCESLTSVVLPDSIENIGAGAFYRCLALGSVVLPKNITRIEHDTFFCCMSLESITIPDGVTNIEYGAFSDCEALTSVIIPEGVARVGLLSFAYCYSLESVTIPKSLTSVGECAFYSCPSLMSVTVPENVTYIYDCAFGFYFDEATEDALPVDGFVLTCYEGSAAHTYAVKNGIAYKLVVPSVSGLGLRERGSDHVTLEWDKTSSVSGYSVELNTDGEWVQVATVDGAETTTYTVTELSPSTKYGFRVGAYIEDGSYTFYGDYTDSIYPTTLPADITGFGVGAKGAYYITLEWDVNASATGYIVEQKNNGTWTEIADITSNTTTSYKVTGLAAFSKYQFRMKAYYTTASSTLYSGYTAVKSPVTNPADMTGFSVNASGSDYITLVWDENTVASGYSIEQYNNGWTEIADIADSGTVTYKVSGLAPATTYKLRMRAYAISGTGNILYSNYTTIVSPVTKPSNMTGFSLKARNYNSITLSWDKNASASGYIIQQLKNNVWTNIANIKDNTVTSYQITGLSANTSYKFRAVAYAASDSSTVYSGYTSAVTISTAPAMTTGFAITGRGSDFLTVSWTKNAGASGYVIQEQIDGVWTKVAAIKGNTTTSYKITGLQPNSFHRYRMVAYKTDANGTCYGKYTGSAPGYTAPAIVTGLEGFSDSATSIVVGWDKISSANGYVIDIYKDGKWSQLAKITSNTITSYKASGLTAGTTYKFRIKSYATNGSLTIYSTYSSAVAVTTEAFRLENLRMTNRGTDFISVRWDKNTVADGYMVYIYDGTKWTCVKTLTNNSSVSHKITGLASGKAYKITVKAYKTVSGTKYVSDSTTISAATL
ncbi:MAG: leucine-rich repeat protein [Ruminiclostridium sp.]|nr:leucine-rich repeat protein [Ruminiclostridium sp.]